MRAQDPEAPTSHGGTAVPAWCQDPRVQLAFGRGVTQDLPATVRRAAHRMLRSDGRARSAGQCLGPRDALLLGLLEMGRRCGAWSRMERGASPSASTVELVSEPEEAFQPDIADALVLHAHRRGARGAVWLVGATRLELSVHGRFGTRERPRPKRLASEWLASLEPRTGKTA